jgi:hypothetical protein
MLKKQMPVVPETAPPQGESPVADESQQETRTPARYLQAADQAAQAVRMLAVMSLAGGRIDPVKIALVQEYADAVGVHESYVVVLAEAAGEIAAASACMIRKNAESFPRLDLAGIDADPIAPFLPYRDGREDPGLAARYQALGELAAGTFGRAFFDHFKRNGFAFPGDPNGLAEGFTTPHDSSHVLSSYTTSHQGELLCPRSSGPCTPTAPCRPKCCRCCSPGIWASP